MPAPAWALCLSQAIPAKVERRKGGVEALCLCARPPPSCHSFRHCSGGFELLEKELIETIVRGFSPAGFPHN